MTTNIEKAWGSGPTARYEALAARFRPVFARIAAGAVERDRKRRLPHEELRWLREVGFTTLRLPSSAGGFDATLPELFALLIELSEADTNVTNALRAHFGFTEDVLNARDRDFRTRWIGRLADRETVGSGFSESGESKMAVFSTTLVQRGEGWLLNGRKFYTSGSLFADWINLGAVDGDGNAIRALVPVRAPGVEILDDWDGFGQALSASGTAIFTDVELTDDLVVTSPDRFPYSMAFFQLVHLATLAGLGRRAADDVARLVAERKRVYSHGNAARAGEDPQILQVVGRVRGAAYAAGAVALKAAESVQRVYEVRQAEGSGSSAEMAAVAVADLEINQSVTPITSLILDATTQLFDALGASAAKQEYALDRHWRNARTIVSHNPRIYRDRIVGDFAVNGTLPSGPYRVGEP